MEEKYFVLSDGDSPFKIYFDKKHIPRPDIVVFLDAFDETGEHVACYKYHPNTNVWDCLTDWK